MRPCRQVFFLLGLLSLAGCAGKPAAVPPPVERAPSQPARPAAEPAAPEVIPPVPPPKPPPPKPAERPPAPSELIGLDQEGVIRLLGDPADNRTEGAARVFTYALTRHRRSCKLDVIFFLDVKTGTERVLSYEQRPASGRPAALCYTAMRSGR